jgi:hypothetical protein
VKANGNPIGLTCSWKASGGQISFTLSDGSEESDSYWVVDGGAELQIDQQVWQAVCSTSTPDQLIGTWQRDDGYTLVFSADGTFTPGPASGWAWVGPGTWTDADGVVTVNDDQHDVFPATYTVQGDTLTLGGDGPLQAGVYHRVGGGS